jgi:hypothetical protein
MPQPLEVHRAVAASTGEIFVVHMDREAPNDYPLGLYDITVEIDALQDAMLTAEFDPRLFGPVILMPEVGALRVSQFVEMLRGPSAPGDGCRPDGSSIGAVARHLIGSGDLVT